jgi:hypothetical protein
MTIFVIDEKLAFRAHSFSIESATRPYSLLLLFIIFTNYFRSSVQASKSVLFAGDTNILLTGENDSDLQQNVTTVMQQMRL